MVLAFQLLLGLVAILFIVGIVFSTKTWKWFHITALSFVFIATFFYLSYAAMVLKTRKVWGEMVVALEKKLEPALLENEKLIVGDPTTANDPLATVPGAKGSLTRVLVGRGRVWRGCVVGDVNATAGTITLSTPTKAGPPAAPGAEPSEPSPNGIAEKSVLYGFLEEKIDDTFSAPRVYLGEFEASAVTPNSVTLRPTIPLDQAQVAALRTGNWTLYEVSPTDSHDAIEDLLKLSKEDRAGLMRQLIRKWPGTDDAWYNRMIEQYVRDGQATLPDDPPERVWVKVKFKANHEVTVDSSTMQVRMDSENYDLNGQAVVPTLRRGEVVKFKSGEFAVFNQQKADELIGLNVCERVENVYLRELNDYKHHFHEIYNRLDYLDNRLAEVKRQVDTLAEAQKRTQAQIDYRTQEKSKLQKDLAQFESERNAITEYNTTLTARRDSVRARIVDLYRTNLALADELATAQSQLTDEINQRTREAAAAATAKP